MSCIWVWPTNNVKYWIANIDYSFNIEVCIYIKNGTIFTFTGSSASGDSRKEKINKSGSPAGSGGSDTETGSIASVRLGCQGERIPLVQAPNNLGNMSQDMSGSRQSFRMAMGNPCEFFVDVM